MSNERCRIVEGMCLEHLSDSAPRDNAPRAHHTVYMGKIIASFAETRHNVIPSELQFHLVMNHRLAILAYLRNCPVQLGKSLVSFEHTFSL